MEKPPHALLLSGLWHALNEPEPFEGQFWPIIAPPLIFVALGLSTSFFELFPPVLEKASRDLHDPPLPDRV